MIENLLIAISLAMDSFAVSISKWIKNKESKIKLAIIIAIFFWFFQFFMTVIWFYLWNFLLWFVEKYSSIIWFLLLSFIWAKMIKESFEEDEENEKNKKLSYYEIFILAIATSIDALLVWLNFSITWKELFEASIIIWLVAFILSFLWFYFWKKIWIKLRKKAEVIWWLILILIWIKILII